MNVGSKAYRQKSSQDRTLQRPGTANPKLQLVGQSPLPSLKQNIVLSNNDIDKQMKHLVVQDYELHKVQLDFHLDAQRRQAQDQKNTLMKSYEDNQKLLQELNKSKIDILIQEHREEVNKLKKEIENARNELFQKMQDQERLINELKKDQEKALQQQKEELQAVLLQERTKFEIEKKNYAKKSKAKMLKQLEKQTLELKEQMEIEKKAQVKFIFEKMHAEYEAKLKTNTNSIVREKNDQTNTKETIAKVVNLAPDKFTTVSTQTIDLVLKIQTKTEFSERVMIGVQTQTDLQCEKCVQNLEKIKDQQSQNLTLQNEISSQLSVLNILQKQLEEKISTNKEQELKIIEFEQFLNQKDEIICDYAINYRRAIEKCEQLYSAVINLDK